jgi:hypothetical protein
MKRTIGFFATGVAASFAAVYAGNWLFVSGLTDWNAFFASIFNFLGATAGLGAALLLGSLLFDQPLKGNIALAGLGAVCGLVAVPLLGNLATEAWKVAYIKPQFARLCKEAHIDVRPMEARPPGVLLQGNLPAEFLLNQSDLQFVERAAKRKPPSEGVAYEQLEVQGERGRRSSSQSGPETHFKVTPIAAPRAPVQASISAEYVDKGRTITQRKVRLSRRSDGATFVSASIYWHKTLEKTCPEGGSMNEIYAGNLLLRAMNMPEVPLIGH